MDWAVGQDWHIPIALSRVGLPRLGFVVCFVSRADLDAATHCKILSSTTSQMRTRLHRQTGLRKQTAKWLSSCSKEKGSTTLFRRSSAARTSMTFTCGKLATEILCQRFRPVSCWSFVMLHILCDRIMDKEQAKQSRMLVSWES